MTLFSRSPGTLAIWWPPHRALMLFNWRALSNRRCRFVKRSPPGLVWILEVWGLGIGWFDFRLTEGR